MMFKVYIKKFLKKNFPNIFEILKIFWTNIVKRKKSNIKFSGWGLTTTLSTPWLGLSKNKTYIGFNNAKKILDNKIKNKEFTLQQAKNYYENVSFEDTFNLYEELRYRHYVVYYSALVAFENTKSKNIVECGVAEGLSIFFSLSKFKEDKNYKAYLYDGWEKLRSRELTTEKDKKRKNNYFFLDLEVTKKNLSEFNNNIIYNKGFIPESFQTSTNPENISWLSIHLNSSMPTLEALNFFYPKLEKNGVILFDDYGFDSYEDTRLVIENFFENKEVLFFQLMTGQALVIKKS